MRDISLCIRLAVNSLFAWQKIAGLFALRTGAVRPHAATSAEPSLSPRTTMRHIAPQNSKPPTSTHHSSLTTRHCLSRPSPLATTLRNLALVTSHLALATALSPLLVAQTETATIAGRVSDPSGAIVPDATLRLVNIDKGTETDTKSNGSGIYVIPAVQPGRYRMQVERDGFKVANLTGLTVNVQDNLEENFRLEVGSVSESVTVSAEGNNINTTDASVSTVVDRHFVENMPLNGRSFQSLIQLTPGVVLTATNDADSGQFSVNGQRGSSNYWMVDGVSANIGIGGAAGGPSNGFSGAVGSTSATGGTNSLVSVDALQEFRIQTSTYAPEFGRTPGGQISIETRSGTNAFHGVIFDYFRNDALDASNWFNGYTNNPSLPKAKERQNDFGGTLGGPLFKNKTFFFFSYEGLRLQLPQTTINTVPCDSTCTGFGNARTKAIPAMQPLFNAYPLPNGPEEFKPCTPGSSPSCVAGEESTGTAQFSASYANPASLDAYSIRIDDELTDKLRIFGRFNNSPSNTQARTGNLTAISSTPIDTRTATIGADWQVSPNITNSSRFNYSKTDTSQSVTTDNFGGSVPVTPQFPAGYNIQNSYVSFSNYGLTGGGAGAGSLGRNIQRQFNVVDNLSVQKGQHNFKFGADLRFLAPIYDPDAYSQESYFSNIPSAETGTLDYTYLIANDRATFLFSDLGFYAQDTWRLTQHLTFTYGLRWDIEFAPSSLNGPSLPALSGFDLQDFSTVGLAPAGSPPFHTRYGNVAPRFGAAYQLSQDPKWNRVIRGGIGVFYDLASSEIGNTLLYGYPFGARTLPSGGTYPLPPSMLARPVISASEIPSGTLAGSDPNLNLPHTLEWNLALEQSLGTSQSVSISYVGAAGRKLLETATISSPNANVGNLLFTTNGGTSDYDALQLQFNRRLSHGLQALVSYTWAHSIDTASAGSNYSTSNSFLPSDVNANRGPSDFDIRSAFTAGLTYNIPSVKMGAIANAVLSDWSIQNIVQASTAAPVDIEDINFEELNNGIQQDIRPDLVPGQSFYLYGSQYPGGKAFNVNAFQDPPVDPSTGNPTRNGDVPRNFLRGFGVAQWDLAVHREFPLRDSLRLQFRTEMFNVLNHPNFGPPIGLYGYPPFGLSNQTLNQYLDGGLNGSVSGSFSPLYQLGGPRSIQLALRLQF